MPSLCMIGWTYRMGASTLEEFLKIPESQWISSFASVTQKPFVFLATCNRLEFYFVSDSPDDSRFSFLDGRLTSLTGTETMEHVFKVASGLDSLSVGEGEILGQVKRAFDEYLKRGQKDVLLTETFMSAIRAGKAVRQKTGISTGKVSVPSVFTKMLKNQVRIEGSRIAVIGSGKMGMGFVRLLTQNSPEDISLIYRNYPPKEKVVALHQYPFSKLSAIIPQSDIVIAATTSKEPILFPDMFPEDRKFVVVDVSNPANVHPDVRKKQNVVYLDLSDLDRFVSSSLGERSVAIHDAEKIIVEETVKLDRKIKNHMIEEYLGTFYGNAISTANEEIDKFKKELSKGKTVDHLLGMMMTSFTNKIMHPITSLVRSISEQDPQLLQALKEKTFPDQNAGLSPAEDRKATQNLPARSRRSTQKP